MGPQQGARLGTARFAPSSVGPYNLMILKITPTLPEPTQISGSISLGILRGPSGLKRVPEFCGSRAKAWVRCKFLRAHKYFCSALRLYGPKDNTGPQGNTGPAHQPRTGLPFVSDVRNCTVPQNLGGPDRAQAPSDVLRAHRVTHTHSGCLQALIVFTGKN